MPHHPYHRPKSIHPLTQLCCFVAQVPSGQGQMDLEFCTTLEESDRTQFLGQRQAQLSERKAVVDDVRRQMGERGWTRFCRAMSSYGSRSAVRASVFLID